MWRARPDFLPTGSGSDLAHHLALLAYIERHGRLVHDATLGAYLGEMIDYTPGAHLLAVLAAAWLRTDALHAIHPVVALTAALKSGIVFLIARRLMPDGMPRVPFAMAAALLLWLPYAFFAGSFMEQSFLSQAVSELFAVAMWGAVVAWGERPTAGAVAMFALFGAAAFLTWPIWIGPLALTLGCDGAPARVSCRGRAVSSMWRSRLLPIGDRDGGLRRHAPGLRLPHGERRRLRDLADAARPRMAVHRAGGRRPGLGGYRPARAQRGAAVRDDRAAGARH